MFIEELYLEEMDKLLADAKLRLVAEWPDTEIYTVSVWTDPNAAVSAVSFDTLDNSLQQVRQSNGWAKKNYDRYMVEGDVEMAALFQSLVGRNQNPADFRFSKIGTIEHRSFGGAGEPIQIAGGETPNGSPIWPALEPLLRSVQERARLLYRDLRLNPDARIAINSPAAWYDHEIPMAGLSPN